jgi:hypothetical protein
LNNNESQVANYSNLPEYSVDDQTRSALYDDGFSELCGWLEDFLSSGFVVSLVTVKDKYEEILKFRKEPFSEGTLRTQSIRLRLNNRFKNNILFTKLNNRQGVFISWNNLTTITESILSNSSTSNCANNIRANNVYEYQKDIDLEAQSKVLLQTIELLRKAIAENMHYLKKTHENNKLLADFSSGVFWDCIPLIIKNFVGLLTTNDDKFQEFKNNYEYNNIFNQDMYKSSGKSLKISAIAYDVINAKYDSYSTPKHLLLGNELFHHVRSSHLLNIMNRFGHTCSYETIVSETQ